MTTSTETAARKGGGLPPRFVIRAAWVIHRALYRVLGRRRALRPVTEKTWGMMRIHTTGRKTGKPRAAILGYYQDGPNIVTMAMNGTTATSLTAGPHAVQGRPRWSFSSRSRAELAGQPQPFGSTPPGIGASGS
jgi:hypothetical protein